MRQSFISSLHCSVAQVHILPQKNLLLTFHSLVSENVSVCVKIRDPSNSTQPYSRKSEDRFVQLIMNVGTVSGVKGEDVCLLSFPLVQWQKSGHIKSQIFLLPCVSTEPLTRNVTLFVPVHKRAFSLSPLSLPILYDANYSCVIVGIWYHIWNCGIWDGKGKDVALHCLAL